MLLLQERQGEQRLLPIMIGGAEASAIYYALEGVEPPRPLTHDLFVGVLQQIGVGLERVVVTEVRDHTFYAELHLTTPTGPQTISSRPSDAVALAVRFGAPLFAAPALLDEVGQPPVHEPDEIIDEFKDFIDHVNPDDFAG
jgi:bifunctional DNase/RNase